MKVRDYVNVDVEIAKEIFESVDKPNVTERYFPEQILTMDGATHPMLKVMPERLLSIRRSSRGLKTFKDNSLT